MQRTQAIGQGVTSAGQALRSGDQGGAGHAADLSDGEK
jgi:type IV secretory pathway TrbL component